MAERDRFTFEIRKATRTSVKPIIALYGISGSGKTYSSLLLARGLAGDSGKIILADSEARRGSLYADLIPGGYETIDLNEPFSPQQYVQAMLYIEQQKAAVGIIDSGSHEWEGLGGVLELASEREAASGKAGLHNWKEPKMAHQRWVQHFLQSPIPWIICLRAKHKARQTKDERGKTVIVKDDFTSPIQAEDFIFEMTAHMEVLQDHSVMVTKCNHPQLRKCFPEDKTKPLSIEHGRLVRAWCESPGGAPAPDPRKALKKELWEVTASKHGGDPRALEQWLWDEAIISDTETLEGLTKERFPDVIKKAKEKLTP